MAGDLFHTNSIGIAFAEEDPNNRGAIPASGWKEVGPNNIGDFRNNTTTLARDPINRDRQMYKGAVTDRDGAISLDGDLTLSTFDHFDQGFIHSIGKGKESLDLSSTGSDSSDGFVGLTALTTEQATRFPQYAIIYAHLGEHEGFHIVDTAASSGDTTISVASTLTTEAETVYISRAGYQIQSSVNPTWSYNSVTKEGTLTAASHGLAATGLTPGQSVYIGTYDEANDTITNAFQGNAANDTYGYARVKEINAGTIVFDDLDDNLKRDGTTTTALNIMYSAFLYNVPIDHADYRAISYQFENAFERVNGDNYYKYGQLMRPNTVSFSLPQAGFATTSWSFMGRHVLTFDESERATGAINAQEEIYDLPLSTSTDIAKMRIRELDEEGITTDFDTFSLSITNNVSPKKSLAYLGPRRFNVGTFGVSATTQVWFNDRSVIDAVDNNTLVSMSLALENAEGALVFDIPTMTLGDGTPNFPRDDTVSVNLTCTAVANNDFNTSIGISIFRGPFKPVND